MIDEDETPVSESLPWTTPRQEGRRPTPLSLRWRRVVRPTRITISTSKVIRKVILSIRMAKRMKMVSMSRRLNGPNLSHFSPSQRAALDDLPKQFKPVGTGEAQSLLWKFNLPLPVKRLSPFELARLRKFKFSSLGRFVGSKWLLKLSNHHPQFVD